MSLSDIFFKRTGKNQPAGKDIVNGHAALIFEKLDALAALPRDRDGYSFKYSTSYLESEGRVSQLEIDGGYFDSRGRPKTYNHYRTAMGDYQPLTSKFHITVIAANGSVPGKRSAGFWGTAWNVDTHTGFPPVTSADTAPQLIDKFLKQWIWGNVPDAARRLEVYKEDTATPAGRTLQKLKKFAFG